MTPYVELQVTTNFSFLRGGSHPEELVATAFALGYEAIAVTDHNSLAGIVRAHVAATEAGLRLVVGCRLDLADGTSLLCYPTDRAAYARLTRLLSLGRRRARKGQCPLSYKDVVAHGEGQILVALAERAHPPLRERLARLSSDFVDRLYLALTRRFRPDEAQWLQTLADLAASLRVPTVATNDVLYHVPERRLLQDVLTCIRTKCSIDALGFRREHSADRFLKPPAEMVRLFARHPEAIARTTEIAARCRFSLAELAYQYPDEALVPGLSAQQALEKLAFAGARCRYPEGVPEKVAAQLHHELAVIAELDYAPYFLTVWRIVDFAKSRGILCQGRGSAANSAVCFCLGVTAIDPARSELLFERFVSAERGEPPDIDVDFEHDRREEVIQWVYETYGREHAALTATVIRYRSRSALREVGKALGLPEDMTAALAGLVWGCSVEGVPEARVRELGLDPADWRLRLTLGLAGELVGFPRHLSQHPGGFVITRDRLDDLVPIENAAMEGRTVIEWDKDDLDAMRMMKVDLLGLGMLGCLRRAFELLREHQGLDLDLATIPAEDPEVYDMLCRADTVGVFQVESRAQMAMLPRLRPRTWYDLVIEVAIVRPGPIQGDMVHPYIRRRQGREPVAYPSPELAEVLGKTLGVPLFQEQVMQMAIKAAGFTPSEADRLRRAMATFRHVDTIRQFRERFIEGMAARGYTRDFAERCFAQIEGFGSYGFPESHAASFAILVYASAWIKYHHPDVFACAILNAQPMGFYAPAQLVRNARAHDVAVHPVDINHSHWDAALEPISDGYHAVRLGFRLVKGLTTTAAARLIAARHAPFCSVEELWRRTGLTTAALEPLAAADAFGSLGLDRRRSLWAIRALQVAPLPLFAAADAREGVLRPELVEPEVTLAPMTLGSQVVADYARLTFSLRRHPLAFLREDLAKAGLLPAEALARLGDGSRLALAGLVLVRQRPGSAKGVIFVTLEDETGIANLVVWPPLFERFRRIVLSASLLGCAGRLQRVGPVVHVVAEELFDLSGLLRRIGERDEAFPLPHGRGDEARGGGHARDINALGLTRRPTDVPDHGAQAAIKVRSRDFR
jgi:error-prone DNA polymerase